MNKLILAVAAAMAFTGTVAAESSPQEILILQNLKQKYPNTVFKSVGATPIPGVFEVIMGKNIAYVEETGRYFLFGHLFDMQTQTDLTEPKLANAAPKISWDMLNLNNAIKTVKGNGSRKMAVFSDPDCPFCKKLEVTLESVKDVTIYTFLMPLVQLHPQAPQKSVAVWCAKDRSAAWSALMLKGQVAQGTCDNPIEDNLRFAAANQINGTPSMIFEDGTLVPGATSLERIESLLSRKVEGAK